MERLERAGNDAVRPPEPTDVPRSAWGTIDPEIRPKYSAPFLTENARKAEKLTGNGIVDIEILQVIWSTDEQGYATIKQGTSCRRAYKQ
jgi:hypothetical protein